MQFVIPFIQAVYHAVLEGYMYRGIIEKSIECSVCIIDIFDQGPFRSSS